MKQKTRQKIQLIVNIVLTVISLAALTVSMFAWFSTRQYADIRSIELQVQRQKIDIVSQPKSYLFPCATKIGDVTKEDFNQFCCITGTYVIKGDGQLYVDITNTDGVLGYVLDGTESSDYYTVISQKLEQKLGNDWKSKSYNDLQKAMREINLSRRVGTKNKDGNTEFTIVCWAEYTKFETALNKIQNGIYQYNQIQNLKVDITFIA